MDLTPYYVRMCTLTPELQARWVPLPWDYISCRVDNSVTCILPGKPVNKLNSHWVDGTKIQGKECCGFKVEHVWLPRQDQIQDIIFRIPGWTGKYHRRFAAFINHKKARSTEQMWLRYYMALTYKKVWYLDEWEYDRHMTYGYKR